MSKERKNDSTVKIFALIIAIILWSYVMSEENPTKTRNIRNVPVSMNNIKSLEDKGLVVIDPVDPTIDIEISARRNTLNRLDDSDILVTVDLEGYEEGSHKLPVKIEVPGEVKVVDYNPKNILFKFEKIVRKESPIIIETNGELPESYVLGEINHKPHSIYIEGPRTWVESVDKVVSTIELTDRTEDISVNAPIKLVDAEGNIIRGVEQEKASVDIFVPVYKKASVPVQLNFIGEGDSQNTFKLKPDKVEIMGKKEVIDGIKSLKTKPLDRNALKPNMEVDLVVAEGVTIIDKNRPKLIIESTGPDPKDPEEDKDGEIGELKMKFPFEKVKLLGLKEGLKLDTSNIPGSVDLVIYGKKEEIDKVKEEDIELKLNLENAVEGENKTPVLVTDRPGLTLEVSPKDLYIRLIKED